MRYAYLDITAVLRSTKSAFCSQCGEMSLEPDTNSICASNYHIHDTVKLQCDTIPCNEVHDEGLLEGLALKVQYRLLHQYSEGYSIDVDRAIVGVREVSNCSQGFL